MSCATKVATQKKKMLRLFEKWGGSSRSVLVQDPTKELEENLKKGAANKLLQTS